MGIKLIYLLQGTAAAPVLLPAQKCYEKCSLFPYSCTSMQGSHFLSYIYLALSYIESRLEKHQSTLIIKIVKNYMTRAYQACSSTYQRSRGWESHTLSPPYYLSVCCSNRLPSRWWCYFNYFAPWSLGSSQAAQNNYGKSCFRILQLLELHLQVISCSIPMFLLVERNVADIDVKLNILTIALMKTQVTGGRAPSHKQEEVFLGEISFPEISVCYKLRSSPGLVA